MSYGDPCRPTLQFSIPTWFSYSEVRRAIFQSILVNSSTLWMPVSWQPQDYEGGLLQGRVGWPPNEDMLEWLKNTYIKYENNKTESFAKVPYSLNGPPATGGALAPPLGLDFKLPKNGFSEAPQTSQVPRMYLWANFGQKIFLPHHPPRTSWPLKEDPFCKKQRFCIYQ